MPQGVSKFWWGSEINNELYIPNNNIIAEFMGLKLFGEDRGRPEKGRYLFDKIVNGYDLSVVSHSNMTKFASLCFLICIWEKINSLGYAIILSQMENDAAVCKIRKQGKLIYERHEQCVSKVLYLIFVDFINDWSVSK